MRRPKRLPPPFPIPATDEFRLPLLSLMAEVCETPEERAKRVRKVRRVVFRFYRRTVEHLGEDGARKLFEGFSRRRRGHPAGSRNPMRDSELYEEYRVRLMKVNSEAEREALPRVLAEELDQTWPGYFGNSAASIEKKVRRIFADQREPKGRLEAARKQLEAARGRPLTEPWRGTKRTGAIKPDKK